VQKINAFIEAIAKLVAVKSIARRASLQRVRLTAKYVAASVLSRKISGIRNLRWVPQYQTQNPGAGNANRNATVICQKGSRHE
jgi:hypothetical protein